MQAYASMYSCQRDSGLPVYTETARLRVDATGLDLRIGDTITYAEREFSISGYRDFPSACRTVIDVVRADLDPAAVREFEHLQYVTKHGVFASEEPQPVGTIMACLIQDGLGVVPRHESRQAVGTCRLFLQAPDARQLSTMSLLRNDGREYKVLSVHDLNLVGKLPYAILQETNNTLPG